MKKIFLITLFVFLSSSLFAQYSNDDWDKTRLNQKTNNLILGIFNPNNFSMNHSFNISMLSSSYGNVSVTSYINSLNYKVNDDLNIRADISLSYSPYANSVFGTNYSNRLQEDYTGISLSRISVDYKISENSFLKFEFRNVKGSELFDDYFYNPFYRIR